MDCAQGIIVLIKAKKILAYDEDELLDKTLSWTVKNMQLENGSFCFLSKKLFSPKIPYIRFQAWMLLSLANVLNETITSNTESE